VVRVIETIDFVAKLLMCLLPNMRRAVLALLSAAMVAGCSPAVVTETINDPYEKQNRDVHEFNKAVDRAIFKPLSRATGGGGGSNQVLRSIGNFASNADLPGMVINNILQANPEDAAHNFMRMVINTTFGIGGLFDPATEWGLPERGTDFGETLYVWGVAEGAYTELPILGPSTSRAVAGRVVDFAVNPLRWVVPRPEYYVFPATSIIGGAASRNEYADAIEDVLYNSTDSYSQLRLLYLQNRRFQLGQTVAAEEVDPVALDTEGF